MFKINTQLFAPIKAEELIGGSFGIIILAGEELAYVKAVEAIMEKTKAERRVVGKLGTLHKSTGTNITGSLTIYKVTSKYRKAMSDYNKSGIDQYFDIQIITEDPTAVATGKEVGILRGVNFDSVNLGMLDPDAEVLEEEMPFTAEDYDLTELFNL